MARPDFLINTESAGRFCSRSWANRFPIMAMLRYVTLQHMHTTFMRINLYLLVTPAPSSPSISPSCSRWKSCCMAVKYVPVNYAPPAASGMAADAPACHSPRNCHSLAPPIPQRLLF